MLPLQAVKSYLQTMKESADANLLKWQDSFSHNPVYALQWVDSIFTHAARLRECSQLLTQITYQESKGLSDEAIVNNIREHTMDIFIQKAWSTGSRSTSQGSNLMDAATVEALAQIVEWLRKTN